MSCSPAALNSRLFNSSQVCKIFCSCFSYIFFFFGQVIKSFAGGFKDFAKVSWTAENAGQVSNRQKGHNSNWRSAVKNLALGSGSGLRRRLGVTKQHDCRLRWVLNVCGKCGSGILTTDEHVALCGKWGNLFGGYRRSKFQVPRSPCHYSRRFGLLSVTHLSRSLATCLISNCNCSWYLSGSICESDHFQALFNTFRWPAIRTPLSNAMPQCPALYLKGPLSSAIFNRLSIHICGCPTRFNLVWVGPVLVIIARER